MDISPTFSDLPLRGETLTALANLGYEEPTPIQAESIPHLVGGRDVLGQAATGTGKTAAFALPMLELLEPADSGMRPDAPVGLIIVPTRELAIQASEATHRYGRGLDARVLPIYGGQPIGRQLHALSRGVDIVVATPGRAVDHISRGSLDLSGIRMVVLDEADEMLDMGFAEDLDTILGALPTTRQTVLFSATMPKRIESLARRHLSDPVTVRIAASAVAEGEQPRVTQRAFLVARAHKAAALGRILDVESPDAAIVFCRTRTEVDELTETLNGRGYRAEALHGGMNQEGRDRVMNRVRSGTADLLIATDVAARGLDIEHLTHVVNFGVPSSPETYVHRIGRVGRAGREGVAITLAEPREQRLLANIQHATGDAVTIAKVPSVADLHERRMELTVESVRASAGASDVDRYRHVVEALAEDLDVFEIAMAAVRLVHETNAGVDDQTEIPEIAPRKRRDDHDGRSKAPGKGRDTDGRGRGERPFDGGKGKGKAKGKWHASDRPMTRLYFPIGRGARVRPGDLVGAIAGETNLKGKDIGSIEIAEKFSLVEVPESAVDEVVRAMKKTTIKGKKVVPRRERFERFER